MRTWTILRHLVAEEDGIHPALEAALPPPAVGGGADRPPPSSIPKYIINEQWKISTLRCYISGLFLKGAERWRASGWGGGRDRSPWRVSHLPVVCQAPPPANRGGTHGLIQEGVEAPTSMCAGLWMRWCGRPNPLEHIWQLCFG